MTFVEPLRFILPLVQQEQTVSGGTVNWDNGIHQEQKVTASPRKSPTTTIHARTPAVQQAKSSHIIRLSEGRIEVKNGWQHQDRGRRVACVRAASGSDQLHAHPLF
ncbi:hypothetical protein V6N11_012678 [Hibiscus sabdariffa]|uniref:Uncharacterized protein n=1 Tax=Hibiscus sabdariffa TaxID=183260 RepID=A0ABR2QC83_9ROSI